MTYTGVNASHKAVSYLTKFSLKVWDIFFQVVGQGQGPLRPSKQCRLLPFLLVVHHTWF